MEALPDGALQLWCAVQGWTPWPDTGVLDAGLLPKAAPLSSGRRPERAGRGMSHAHAPLRTALGYRDSTASLGTLSGASANGDLLGASDDEALDAYDRVRARSLPPCVLAPAWGCCRA